MARPRTTNKHLPKFVTVIHGSYWYRAPKQKPVRIGPVGDDQTLWKFMLSAAEPKGPVQTLADVFDRYQAEVVPTLAPRTQKDYHRHLAILRKWCGHMRPEELQPKHIGAFLNRPTGKIQANRQVAVLSAVYAKAVGRWYVVDKNPCRDVERNPSKRRTRYISDAEYMTVYALAPVRVQIAMDLALLTGQRQGDLLTLPWANALDEGVLFRQGKTGKRLLVGMSPSLKAVLERAKRLVPQLPREYVLRTRSGRPYTSEGFRAIWQRTMRKAVRGGMERFTFHDIRAKCVSDTGNINDAFERAGHTNIAMTRGVYDRGVRKVTPLR